MHKNIKKIASVVMAMAMTITLMPNTQLIITKGDSIAEDSPYCISIDRPVYTSSDNGNNTGDKVVDGNYSTGWESQYGSGISNTQWLYVDLGAQASIDNIHLKWENAYAKSYKIQYSNDEENWTDVYQVGKEAESTTVEGETTTKGQSDISITYKYSPVTVNNNTVSAIYADWSSVDNATYKVCVNAEDNIASAPDGYKFNSHGPSEGSIALEKGTYTLIVIALDKDTKKEVGRGIAEINVTEETTTQAPTTEQITKPIETTKAVDEKDITIDLSKITDKARYVRIYMTEKAMPAYGYHLFEFEVNGIGGVVDRPVDYGTNIAFNKFVKSSGLRDVWWMYDDDGNIDQSSVKAENAVDGSKSTSFTSYQSDKQWLSVDLGQSYDIGRIIVNWTGDAGKVYDYQVSSDNSNWTTIYRNKRGHGNFSDNQQVYAANIRYVRIYGYTRVESGSGIGISELEVYPYKDGDEKIVNTIEDFDESSVVKLGSGSYLKKDMYLEQAKLPTYVDSNSVQSPIASNDWWQSSIINQYGNTMCLLPLKAKYSKSGLEILTAQNEWLPNNLTDTSVNYATVSETKTDFSILPESFNASTGYDSVSGYGDYSVKTDLVDKNGKQMTGTFVKGSPYIFTEYNNNTVVSINAPGLTSIFDDNGNEITLDNTKKNFDHIGIEITDNDNKEGTNTSKSYYCLSVAEGTIFQLKGGKIRITFPSVDENYMSIGTMNSKKDLNSYYRHGYAFATDTKVIYTYNNDSSIVSTNYVVTIENKRTGFSEETMQCMLPHQWKNSTDGTTSYTTYGSPRGKLKAIFANSFSTTQTFAGILPTFAKPTSSDFDSDKCTEYLKILKNATANIKPGGDAYWQGKDVHPLAMGVLMADQLGESEMKDLFISRLKKVMVDWLTYNGTDDISYLIYNQNWGTIYYKDSEFGANAAICDHHFTYGYFVFGAAVLATYDDDFYNDYKDMVDLLIRDYANPSDSDSMFCKFRAFDQYEGHSWAGGYADNDSGNNQESASESLFSWVGMYLWGIKSGNMSYIDAGAYGFTTEMESVEQYWFDYDGDNWISEYPYKVVAQVYGANNFYGTFFGGQPLYCYGIQWLPISEYLTYYGMNQEKCALIYQGLEDDTQRARTIAKQVALNEGKTEDEAQSIYDNYTSADTGWQHITWPFLSQTNPTLAMEKFLANDTKVQNTDQANTYWFIDSMNELGHRTNNYTITGNGTGSVYYNESTKKYTGQVWNPTSNTQTLNVKDSKGIIKGSVKVNSKALLNFNIDENNSFQLEQVSTPVINTSSITGNSAKENVSGNVNYDDTQMVELLCDDEGAKIYYTTDGSVPNSSSNEYKGKILVSTNTVIKAIAMKDGCIDSSYASISMTIDGDVVESSENLALGKTAIASSEKTESKAVYGNDGLDNTRWQAGSESDTEWYQVDLGKIETVNTVKINWEAAYASKYEIQTSLDGENWSKVKTSSGSLGFVTSSFDATKARYVRMQGVQKATQYGYSFYEIQIYGALQANAPTITPISGIYNGNQKVVLDTVVKGAEVKYTLDGTIPTENSNTYTEPVNIDKSTIVKAVTYRKGMILSEITQSSIVISGTIALNSNNETIAVGKKVQLSALTDEVVNWKSKNSNIATVDSNGLVTGITPGSVEIVATTGNGKTATCNITVSEPIHIESVSLNYVKLELKNKTSETLKVIINPADTTDDKTATWWSEDKSIAVVNENGTVTAKSEGNTVIWAKVGTLTTSCEIVVGPAATLTEMIESKSYNVSLNKNAAISSIYSGEGSQTTAVLTDGNVNSNYISTDWNSKRNSENILIDLENNYKTEGIDKVALKFVNSNTFCENFEVQYSSNGVDYATVQTLSDVKYADSDNGLIGIDIKDASSKIDNVRYVKIIMNGHKPYGFQIREAAVLSTEMNLEKVEVDQCDNPEDLILSSENLGEITYTIKQGKDQENYKYIVYLDNERITDTPVSAGTYTLSKLESGNYTVKVVSYYNQAASQGIEKTIYVDDGSLKNYVDTERNLSKGQNVTVDSIYEKEGSQDPATLVDGKLTGTKLETTWGSKTASVVIDLGKEYLSTEIEEVLFAFTASNAYCDNYSILYSKDGIEYDEVYVASNISYKEIIENKIDSQEYNQDQVRFVKINFNGTSAIYGYQMYEIAVMGKDQSKPQEPTETPTEETTTAITTSSDIKVEGFQISTTYEGTRVVGSFEPMINNKEVTKWGFIYGLDSFNGEATGISDNDMTINCTNNFVKAYESTASGTIDVQMGDSATATYYVRTMKFGGTTARAFNANYKVRAYAILSDGTCVYSNISNYSIFNIADYLYKNKLMSTYDSHTYLYSNILTKVDALYKVVDYNWNNSVVKPE